MELTVNSPTKILIFAKSLEETDKATGDDEILIRVVYAPGDYYMKALIGKPGSYEVVIDTGIYATYSDNDNYECVEIQGAEARDLAAALKEHADVFNSSQKAKINISADWVKLDVDEVNSFEAWRGKPEDNPERAAKTGLEG